MALNHVPDSFLKPAADIDLGKVLGVPLHSERRHENSDHSSLATMDFVLARR
jgi:hypothetical protein